MPIIDTRPGNKKRAARVTQLQDDCSRSIHELGDSFDKINNRLYEYNEEVNKLLKNYAIDPLDKRIEIDLAKSEKTPFHYLYKASKYLSVYTISFKTYKAVNLSAKSSMLKRVNQIGLKQPNALMRPHINGAEIVKFKPDVVRLQGNQIVQTKNVKIPKRIRVKAGLSGFAVGLVIGIAVEEVIGAIEAEVALPRLRSGTKYSIEHRLLLSLGLKINEHLFELIGEHLATLRTLWKLPFEMTIEQVDKIFMEQAEEVAALMEKKDLEDFIEESALSLNDLDKSRGSYISEDWYNRSDDQNEWVIKHWEEAEIDYQVDDEID